jgi:NADH-quinone oxidoreductase subunit H
MSPLILAALKIGLVIFGLMTAAAYFVLLERRIAAWVQDRRGPNRVGLPLSLINRRWKDLRLFGLGQPVADGVKFILKEEYTPAHVDQRLFVLAPISILAAALAVFAVIPFGSQVPPIPGVSDEPIPLIVAPGFDVGIIYVFALSSIAVYGVILGGWASNSKYSFLGGLRSSAQMIAYELPLGLGILGVVLATGSLRLDDVIGRQAETGIWFLVAQPLGFIVFVVAAFAEAARLPFDLPEAEQELIGGYHTEYSGLKLLFFLVAEFLHMITAAFLIVILFLGGWHFWGLTGGGNEITWWTAIVRMVVFAVKIVAVILFFMLVRWSWPRFRFDQLMSLAWKVMLPLGLLNLVVVAIVEEIKMVYNDDLSLMATILLGLVPWVTLVVGSVGVASLGPLVTDNRPRRTLHEFEIDPQV